MINLLFLLFLHHVGDVWGQPSWLIENKKKHVFAIYEHVAIWTGLICLGLYILDLPLNLLELLFLFGGHFLIDLTKYQLLPENIRNKYWTIYPDQALHYLQIILVYYL